MRTLQAGLLFALSVCAWGQCETISSKGFRPQGNRRVALVIGNAEYAQQRLVNPLNDAADVARALAEVGFTVTLCRNLNRETQDTSVQNWALGLQSGDTAVFYFSGHGIESRGENYLLPIDFSAQLEAQVRTRALAANEVLGMLHERNVDSAVMILDACRNSPYRSWQRGASSGGLAAMVGSGGDYIAFATAAGSVADDNPSQRNGLFTKHLLWGLNQQGLAIDEMFQKVRERVLAESRTGQRPYSMNGLSHQFSFRAGSIEPPQLTPSSGTGEEDIYWRQCEQNKGPFCETYLRHFPNGKYADLAKLMTSPAPSAPKANGGNEYSAEFESARREYLRNNWNAAFPTFARLAERGHPDSMAFLGRMYASGRGVPKDGERARQWIEKAMAAGSVSAYWAKGAALSEGSGYAKNDRDAAEAYQEGAAAGDALAALNLGVLYANGEGVPKNESKALQLYRTAADAGIAIAMTDLGGMYLSGRGVAADPEEGVRWYRRAADAGNTTGMTELGSLYQLGKGVAKDEREAAMWYRRAADAGDSIGMNGLGAMYFDGPDKDDKEALRWFRRAAELGNDQAIANVGLVYELGRAVTKDEAEAARWYVRAAGAGNGFAMVRLGDMYTSGRGVTKNENTAFDWYKRSAAAGESNAFFALGYSYAEGKGVTKNEAEALTWYRKAADAGNAAAMTNIGVMYSRGNGVPGDKAEAARWARKGAEAGNTQGMRNLAIILDDGDGVPQNKAEAQRWRDRADAAEKANK